MKSLLFISSVLLTNTLLQAQFLHFQANLSPEVTGATGLGIAKIAYDQTAHTLQVDVEFSGLSGNTTVAHIHGPTTVAATGTAGVMTMTPSFLQFPTGVQSGTYSALLDLTSASSFRAGFITASGGTPAGAESAFLSAVNDGKAYFNVHTSAFPGGEIRGFFTPYTPVPEPSTTCAVGAALLGSFAWVRRLRRSNA